MSFIAKNPLTIPEVETPSSSLPQSGTRGLFAGKDGWYDIDSNGNTRKLAVVKEGSDVASAPTQACVNILGGTDNWDAEDIIDSSGNVLGVRYGQIVNVNNAVITKNSKIDLQVTSEQMVVFYEKSLAFVAENDNGVVTVYCVGTIPQNDYTMQAIVTEVTNNG